GRKTPGVFREINFRKNLCRQGDRTVILLVEGMVGKQNLASARKTTIRQVCFRVFQVPWLFLVKAFKES
ncbi:MAG: hypothetical protein NTV55_07245, partial [Planctomycetota bacterium]|nr:hypothetical protein [Planctomycetota bacterium]